MTTKSGAKANPKTAAKRQVPMGLPKRIMLATDLTPACDRAFDRAVQLAEQWSSELMLCHTVEASSPRPWGIERRIRHAQTELERLVASSGTTRKLPHHIIIGDPAERVLEHARDIGCDFLVTGPAHGKMLGDKLLGSTAARILRRATQPVLAVRHRARAPYGRIVTAVDFSQPSRVAFRTACTLFPGHPLTVIHAYHLEPDWSGPNADKSIEEVESAERARVLREAGEDMADLVATARPAGQENIETLLLEGEPETVLADYVDTNWPDLVVAGTHGATGASGDAIGSVAERLLTLLPCDVLAVPTRG